MGPLSLLDYILQNVYSARTGFPWKATLSLFTIKSKTKIYYIKDYLNRSCVLDLLCAHSKYREKKHSNTKALYVTIFVLSTVHGFYSLKDS